MSQRAADGFTFTEEKRRIDAIRFLLDKGYPKENITVETVLLKFGNAGRNSFRVDLAVFDRPASTLKSAPLDERLNHIRLAAEIKRDSEDAVAAKSTQVRPALAFLPDTSAVALYWDDLERTVFYRTFRGTQTVVHEVAAAMLPTWGRSITHRPLTYDDLKPTRELLKVFDQIEDILHTFTADKAKRYTTILQLILVKVFDENRHKLKSSDALDIQDLSTSLLSDRDLVLHLDSLLDKAVQHYQRYLPKKIETRFAMKGGAIRRISKILAPINLLESRQDVMQTFYMRFAKNLYKWDLAQYFTPPEVIDFIVDIANPVYGEHVKDPACGSADFLVSAFRRLKAGGPEAGQSVWGSDNSEQAVQISILNMLLNGDGKTNIKEEDSLETFGPDSRQYDVILCNPPFGTKIVEKRKEILARYDLGKSWSITSAGHFKPSGQVLSQQQTGILFAELCVRIASSGGRVAIILPNGYLGNQSDQYRALRTWILEHCRIAAVIGFPRFTFKKSGADVSASVLLLEKRHKPLVRVEDDLDYAIHFAMIDSVGWRAGDKVAVPLYVRDEEDGSLILNGQNEPVLDADFNKVRSELLRSAAASEFPWLLNGRAELDGPQTDAVSVKNVVDGGCNLDPKRWCAKYLRVQQQIKHRRHFLVGDVLAPAKAPGLRPEASKIYRYTEIQDIRQGDFDWVELRGWQLPGRARLIASPGDVFIASPWGCAGKWFLTPDNAKSLVVTNGCQRFRLKEGSEDLWPDLAVGLCSEAFAVQMRALATGSDGLADVAEAELLAIPLPKLTAKDRAAAEPFLIAIKQGNTVFSRAARELWSCTGVDIAPRRAHWALV
ncbi:MAG: N-6 DNA methylase [Planctomycetota bacterium]|nr:N-6 DNA methylase [Planctomycetota bacterium]